MKLNSFVIKSKIDKNNIICLCFGLFLFLFGYSQESDNPVQRPSNLFPSEKIVTPFHNNWTVGNYQRRIEIFKKDVPNFGCIFFVGNSITQQVENWNEKFEIENIMNRGIAGDVTDGVLKRLNEIVYYQPKAVFILIGINDLFNLHHDEEGKNLIYDKKIPSARYVGKNIIKIAKILHKKLPNTKIYVRTVLPTGRPFLKEDILKINNLILKRERKGYYSVSDLYSEFVDNSGFLIQNLTKDGVHLNDAGYKKWVEFEKPILNELHSIRK